MPNPAVTISSTLVKFLQRRGDIAKAVLRHEISVSHTMLLLIPFFPSLVTKGFGL